MNAPHAHDCGYAFHLDTWANAAQPVGEHGIEMDPNTAEPDYGVLVVSAFTNGNWNVLNVIGADDLCFALAAAGVIRRHRASYRATSITPSPPPQETLG